eukprot:1159419-Pelagomonas_calceolata.AAC.1
MEKRAVAIDKRVELDRHLCCPSSVYIKARSSAQLAILSANPKPELHACVVTNSTRARTINRVASLRHTTAAGVPHKIGCFNSALPILSG